MARPDLRRNDELRRVRIVTDYTMHAEGSALIEIGNTRVLCNASVENKTAPFLAGSGLGWVTAEYAMLPRATHTRSPRDISKLKLSGRSAEIQRLIGRSLRAVLDRKVLGERQIIIDCDVLQADGGTRCASITGGYVALWLACRTLVERGVIDRIPLRGQVAAVSAGLYQGDPILDLCYEEDAGAEADCNIIMTGTGEFVELQCTGEERPFSKEELARLLSLGRKGTAKLCREQRKAIGDAWNL